MGGDACFVLNIQINVVVVEIPDNHRVCHVTVLKIIFFNIYRILYKFNIFGKFSVSFKLRSVAINGVFN